MFQTEQCVYNSEVGPDGHQTNESIVMMMQNCSLASVRAQPDLRTYMLEHHIALMVATRQVDIFRHARYAERITIKTNVYRIRGGLSVRNTGLFGEDGNAVAMCWGNAAFVSLDTGKLVLIPKQVTDLYPSKNKYPMEYLSRKIELPETEPQRFDPVPVTRADRDLYGHLNNARAIRIADEYTPADRTCLRMRCAYHRQAKQGELLYPAVWSTPLEPAAVDGTMPPATAESGAAASKYISDHATLKTTVALETAEGEPYAVVEFTY